MFQTILVTPSISAKPYPSVYPSAERRYDEAPRKSRNGLDMLTLDRFGEGWNFPEGSPIHSQNIIESDNLWNFRNPSPPIAPKDFEKVSVNVKKGMVEYFGVYNITFNGILSNYC